MSGSNADREILQSMSAELPRQVLDNLLEGCQVIGADWTYRYLNDVAVVHARKPRAELLGRTMMAVYPGIDDTPMFAALREAMSTRRHARVDNEFHFPDGTSGWFDLRIIPVPDGLFVMSLDVTRQRRIETALRSSQEKYRLLFDNAQVGRQVTAGLRHVVEDEPADLGGKTRQLLGVEVAKIRRRVDLCQQALVWRRHRREGYRRRGACGSGRPRIGFGDEPVEAP